MKLLVPCTDIIVPYNEFMVISLFALMDSIMVGIFEDASEFRHELAVPDPAALVQMPEDIEYCTTFLPICVSLAAVCWAHRASCASVPFETIATDPDPRTADWNDARVVGTLDKYDIVAYAAIRTMTKSIMNTIDQFLSVLLFSRIFLLFCNLPWYRATRSIIMMPIIIVRIAPAVGANCMLAGYGAFRADVRSLANGEYIASAMGAGDICAL